MMQFILDNSVAMRWLLATGKLTDQTYAETVLLSLNETQAIVPQIWQLEAANVLLGAEKRGQLDAENVEAFVSHLDSLPIVTDTLTHQQVFSRTMSLARAYKLSSYDAAYLELALREGLPIATLDQDLLKAALKANVKIYLK
ncbi:type II toxin-antitoxin system VapC family toxin [Cellvibrio sp. OA-2007]|uniref:type II toxin-antitoxin system VapC family toxin n=1 Tax=Cellvibrio sp. OA-2007 TaxID=529823 RepID=UPI000AF30EEF|nr:type II toxin-antitoxin system VapC family toxin [Cellvibrio sp. OA-2007]